MKIQLRNNKESKGPGFFPNGKIKPRLKPALGTREKTLDAMDQTTPSFLNCVP